MQIYSVGIENLYFTTQLVAMIIITIIDQKELGGQLPKYLKFCPEIAV